MYLIANPKSFKRRGLVALTITLSLEFAQADMPSDWINECRSISGINSLTRYLKSAEGSKEVAKLMNEILKKGGGIEIDVYEAARKIQESYKQLETLPVPSYCVAFPS